MRRRLVLGAVAVVTLALLLFAVPLGVLLRQQIVRTELDGFAGGLEQTSSLVSSQSRTCAEVQVLLARLARADVEVSVFDADRDLRASTAPDRSRVVGHDEVLGPALDGATGTAFVDGTQVAAVPLSTPVCGELLVLQATADGAEVDRAVRGAVLLVLLGAVGAIVAGAMVASALGARLAAPLQRLAASARRLGEGDFSERAPRSGLPEPDRIADALDVTADRLGRAVSRGRAFAADASHQLRTPLTALRLNLEAAEVGLEQQDPRREALDGALAEVDRLAATIDELVALTDVDVVDEEVDVTALVSVRTADWQRRAAELGRDVTLDAAPVPRIRVRSAAVLQAFDVLVDNALRHGAGRVHVRVHPPMPDSSDPALRVVVSDEGPGPPDGLDVLRTRADRGAIPVHGGRGLLLARDLVEGEGGRLVIRTQTRGTSASMLFPLVQPVRRDDRTGVRRATTVSDEREAL